MFEEAVEKGFPANYGLVGCSFGETMKPRPRGPEMRSSRLSFFKEITADEMKSYSPDQIATILEQRNNLHDVLSQEQRKAEQMKRSYYMPSSATASKITPPPGFRLPEKKKPWLPSDDEECQFRICHACRPTCEARSYLSLDGIVNGDVPPTAAVGYGFGLLRIRPISDANIVKNIGHDPIYKLARLEGENSETTESPYISGGMTGSIIDDVDANGEVKSSVIRPPSTPPAALSTWKSTHHGDGGIISFDNHPTVTVTDGRSLNSLKINPIVRRAVFESAASAFSQTPRSLPDLHTHIRHESADPNNVGLAMPSKEVTHSCAADTTRPPSPEEDTSIYGMPTQMMEEEMTEGRFNEEPLQVVDGIAVMEESVEMGIADVMT
ncbi:hypothetical protein BJ170DRAFT_723141 [Xylariales sp. AK1849]|nr:hypothetical protein BJ170DRAFT_723141 [Xylariales sp. AK1849]